MGWEGGREGGERREREGAREGGGRREEGGGRRERDEGGRREEGGKEGGRREKGGEEGGRREEEDGRAKMGKIRNRAKAYIIIKQSKCMCNNLPVCVSVCVSVCLSARPSIP